MLQTVVSPSLRVRPKTDPVHECLRELVVKLRWMGMDAEADKLCRKLEAMGVSEIPPCPQPDTD